MLCRDPSGPFTTGEASHELNTSPVMLAQSKTYCFFSYISPASRLPAKTLVPEKINPFCCFLPCAQCRYCFLHRSAIHSGHQDSPTSFSHTANKAVKQIDLTLIHTVIQVTPPCDSHVPYIPKQDTLLGRHWIWILEIWGLSIYLSFIFWMCLHRGLIFFELFLPRYRKVNNTALLQGRGFRMYLLKFL